MTRKTVLRRDASSAPRKPGRKQSYAGLLKAIEAANKHMVGRAAAGGRTPAESIDELIRDPYVLEFTGLAERPAYSEDNLETALLDHVQRFLLELGAGFCFEARQFWVTTGNRHHRVDLVFYHRRLRCHVLLDLKVRAFRPADAGQMNFYVNWFKANMMAEGDGPSVGIILCSSRKETEVEFATGGMDNKLFVSRYLKVDWLALPVDVKGTIYEERLSRSAQESSRGAGQYFTPRPVIQTMCEVTQPTPNDRICDPAAGTGGFLCNAYQYVLDRFGADLDRDEKRALQEDLVEGMELSPKVGRMCAMNLYLHGIGGDKVVVPDNVLFEGGAGEKVRRNLLQECRVHTLLRLPTGIWYSPGVKANVIFFDKMEGRAAA